MLAKHLTAPILRLTATTLCAIGLVTQITGCSPDTNIAETDKKLEQANQKIAALEAQLAEKNGTAGAAKPKTASAPAAATPSDSPASAIGQQWSYDVTEEKMTGGKRKLASVDSTNTVNFDFPYSGEQHGTITLRTDPQYGKNVMFQIQKGQILCPSYEGCTVQVRFDDEKPSNYSATGPSDNSSETIFLSDYNRFLTQLKKAKRVRLAVNIYQQGTPIFEFDVSGFNVDKYQAKS